MNFLSELKRRNIIRVSIAYTMIAWLILQVLDVITPILQLPPAFSRIVLITLFVIFPIVLIITWAFELTPDGVKKSADVEIDNSLRALHGRKINYLIIGLLLITISMLLINLSNTPDTVSEESNSIAVLPFVNMSEDVNNEYFSDGLSEELLNVLARIPTLKVAGRTSSFAYKGQNDDLREIGRALGVAHVLEGSVRKQDNRVRITAQLIRASDGFHLWSETFDRELSDIFVVQEEIANSIVTNMAISMDIGVTRELISTRTENMRAYELLLESRALISKRGYDNITNAIDMLTEATELDSNYAAAWGALAQAHALSHYFGAESAIESMFLGEGAARRALLIDPTSSMAHTALGDILKDKRQWSTAEAEYRLALTYDPQNVEAMSQYAQLLRRVGRYTEALSYAEKSRLLDPLGTTYHLVEGVIRYRLGETENGLRLLDRSIELGNNQAPFPYIARFFAGLHLYDTEETKEHLSLLLNHNRAPDAAILNDDLISALNDKTKTLEYLRNARDYYQSNPTEINSEHLFGSMILSALAVKYEDYDLAISLLEMEEKLDPNNKNNDAISYHWVEVFEPLLEDARMKQLFLNYGLPQYWDENGWSDFCSPTEDDSFIC